MMPSYRGTAMRGRWLLAIVLSLGLITSCGVSAPATPEQQLRQRAESLAAAASKQDWIGIYKFRSPRFREICKSGDFVVQMGTSWPMFLAFIGKGPDAKVESRVQRETVDGDKGRVFAQMLVDNEPLEFGDSTSKGAGWVFVNGQWWSEAADWEEGCPGIGIASY